MTLVSADEDMEMSQMNRCSSLESVRGEIDQEQPRGDPKIEQHVNGQILAAKNQLENEEYADVIQIVNETIVSPSGRKIQQACYCSN